MAISKSTDGGTLRLVPFTRQSLARQELRCLSSRSDHHFAHARERNAKLPDCEQVRFADGHIVPKRFLYMPLEDASQFGFDKTFCVLVKKSSSYYLYRISAEDSLFIWSPWSPVRRFAIKISCHRYFELFVMTTILLNCVFLALTQPIEETEYVFLVIYTIEMIIKTIAKGFILNKYSYLRNPWNWLDFIVVLSGYITLALQFVGVAIGNLAGLRTFRVLRAFKTVSITPGLKTIVNAMLHSLRMLAEVMTLTVFCLMVFALLALQLYLGTLRHKCVLHMGSNNVSQHQYSLYILNRSTWLMESDGQPAICGNKTGARHCPENYTCLPDVGDNPNYGFTNFDSYGWALLTTFQLITLDFWEDVYNKINAATGPISAFFFLLVVFFGSFYLINLTLAVVAIAYEEEAQTALKEKDKVRKFSTGIPSKLSSTLSALKFKTKIIPPKFGRRVQPARWCTPRSGMSSSVRPIPSLPSPLPQVRPSVNHNFGSSNVSQQHRQSSSSTGVLREADEDEEDFDFPHPMCVGGPAPDIVISTGGRLPSSRRENTTIYLDSPSEVILSPSSESDYGAESDRVNNQMAFSPCARFLLHLGNCFSNCRHHIHLIMDTLKRLRSGLKKIVDDPLFDSAIMVCILLNTAFLSAEHHGMSSKMERILKLGNLMALASLQYLLESIDFLIMRCESWRFGHKDIQHESEQLLRLLMTHRKVAIKVFTIVFTLEACVKMLALGRSYFRSRWNVFDLVVVVVSLADLSFETVGGLSVLRTFRLLRVVKLAQAWSTMRLLLTIIASTLGAVGNMTLVLAVIVYIFAIMGVQLFSDLYTPENFAPDPLPRWNFTDFWHSLLMMFRILCGEWVEPLWDCMRVAGDRKNQVCVVLFLTALTVGNFLVLNLFLAMLLNSFNTQELEEHKKKTEKDYPNSKLLKGIRRIRGVIRRQPVEDDEESRQLPIFAPRATTQRPETFSPHRRWSEPGTPTHLLQFRRASDLSGCSIPIKDLQNLRIRDLPVIGDSELQKHSSNSSIHSEEKGSSKKPKPEPPPCCPFFYCSRSSAADTNCCCRVWVGFRRCILRVVDHKAFEWSVLTLIFASSVVLCFEDVYLSEKPLMQWILNYVNIFFTCCFVLEVLLKWFAYGLVVYFGSLWTTMDFIIVCVSVASIVAESSGSGLYALRAIRTLRALRPLRAISRWQGMKIVVNALMSAIPSIINVLLVCLVFWLIFSIMGVQFFAGKFYRCIDTATGETLPPELTPNYNICLHLNHSWINRDINFDNVGNAYLALFQVATFEGWMEVMEYATDTTGVGRQPYPEANFLAYIYFVTFIICGSFFTLNLFIGVIIDNFNMLKKKYEGGIVEMFLTDSQKTYYTAMLKLGKKKPQRIVRRPQNLYIRFFYDVAVSRKFEMFVFLLIFLNMVAMTLEHYHQPPQVTSILETLNVAFTAMYGAEAFIKIIGLRQYYFTFPWNVFDLCVLVASVIGILFEEALQNLVISPTLLRVIRMVRIGRVLRLIKAAKGIRKLLFALVISLPALFNIGALLFLVTFVYAIIGMSLFGHVRVEEGVSGGGLNEMINFRTFASSMALLFRLTTSAGWNDVLESLMVQPPNCDRDFLQLPNGDCGHPTVAVIYLVTYIIINFMVIINMYIAVILENLSQASKEDTGITEEDIEMFYLCWSQYDPNATQFIHYSQVSDFVASLDPPLRIEKPNQPVLIAMNLPISSGDRIHCLDILHSLVSHVLGDVEDTQEFRVVQQQVDQRFRKTFPTRNQVEIISTTLKRKQNDNAAKTIQRMFRKHLERTRKNRIGVEGT